MTANHLISYDPFPSRGFGLCNPTKQGTITDCTLFDAVYDDSKKLRIVPERLFQGLEKFRAGLGTGEKQLITGAGRGDIE
jgi:hypothetical protein